MTDVYLHFGIIYKFKKKKNLWSKEFWRLHYFKAPSYRNEKRKGNGEDINRKKGEWGIEKEEEYKRKGSALK